MSDITSRPPPLVYFDEAEEVTPESWERMKAILAQHPHRLSGIATDLHGPWLKWANVKETE